MKDTRVEKQCLQCDNIFLVKLCRLERSKFCSRGCTNEWWKGKNRGEATKINQFKKGQMPWNYNNGRMRTTFGYIGIKRDDHPRANPNGYVSEHLLVWEEHHQRALPRDWVIHHINGIKDDNRIENLVAMPKKNHHPALDPQYIKERLREVEKQLEQSRQDYKELKGKYERLLSERRNT